MISSVSPLQFSCGVLCGAGPVGKILEIEAKHEAVNDADAVLQAFVSWILSGATWLVTQVIAFLKDSTSIDIGTSWFVSRATAMADVALILVLPMVLAATIGAIIRQDTKRLVRIYAVGIPLAGTATIFALALASEAVAIVDTLCAAIAPKQKLYRPLTNIDGDMTKHHVPIIIAALLGATMIIAGLVLWLELILRSIVVDITVFFLPLALAAIVWPATAQIAKRFVEVLVAVIGSKFVIVATLSLAEAMAFHPHATPADAVKACAILLLAAFAPMALLRLVPLVEVAAIAHMEGMSRRPLRAAVGATSSTAAAGRSAAGLLLGGSGAGVEGGSVAATGVQGRKGESLDDLLGGAGGGGASSQGGSSPGGSSLGGSFPGDTAGTHANDTAGTHPDTAGTHTNDTAGRAHANDTAGGSAPAWSPATADHAAATATLTDHSPSASTSPWLESADLPEPSDLPGPLPILGSPPTLGPERSGGEDG